MTMHLNRSLVVSLVLVGGSMLAGCFGSSSSPITTPGTASDADADGALDSSTGASPDATIGDAGSSDATGDGGGSATSDSSSDGPRGPCPVSTCAGVEVIFGGWIAGADGGPELVQVAVDQGTLDGGANGTVVQTTSATDPALGHENLLVGDFVTTGDGGTLASPLAYANDNNGCDVPDFAGRTNAYYLAPMQGLPVDPSWFSPQCGCGGNCGGACLESGTGGACDYESALYSQTCPNFGYNCVVTPRKIESIQVIATSADATCKVCFYDATSPSASTSLRCVSPGTTLSGTELYGAGVDASASYPRLLRLDDGSSCASY
jgi:hypothetical protein